MRFECTADEIPQGFAALTGLGAASGGGCGGGGCCAGGAGLPRGVPRDARVALALGCLAWEGAVMMARTSCRTSCFSSGAGDAGAEAGGFRVWTVGFGGFRAWTAGFGGTAGCVAHGKLGFRFGF